jgi:hypothetical protein
MNPPLPLWQDVLSFVFLLVIIVQALRMTGRNGSR